MVLYAEAMQHLPNILFLLPGWMEFIPSNLDKRIFPVQLESLPRAWQCLCSHWCLRWLRLTSVPPTEFLTAHLRALQSGEGTVCRSADLAWARWGDTLSTSAPESLTLLPGPVGLSGHDAPSSSIRGPTETSKMAIAAGSQRSASLQEGVVIF
jgi:hypothetical protein